MGSACAGGSVRLRCAGPRRSWSGWCRRWPRRIVAGDDATSLWCWGPWVSSWRHPRSRSSEPTAVGLRDLLQRVPRAHAVGRRSPLGHPSRRALDQAGEVSEGHPRKLRAPRLRRYSDHRLPTRRLTPPPMANDFTSPASAFHRACAAPFPVQQIRFPRFCPITAASPTVLPPSLGRRALSRLPNRRPKAT